MSIAVHIPNMGDLVSHEVAMYALTNADEPIPVSGGKPQKLQFPVNLGGVGHQVGGRFRIRCRGKSPDPSKGVEMGQANIQRLTTPHRKPGQSAAFTIRKH